jgi:Protein of unknown function (DUF3352)
VIRRAALAIAAVAVTALLATGCGGGGGSSSAFTGPDPAAMTPADAPLFAEAVVRPEGNQKAALDGSLSKLLATDDPGGFLADRIDQALSQGHAGIDYEHDVAPWLGPRAGLFVKSFTNNADGAFLLSTTDAAASQRTIDKVAEASRASERRLSYKGVHYLFNDKKDTAAGVVGDFVVIGSQVGFKDAVDAEQGSSLADSGEFQGRLDQAPDDQVAFAYADPKGIVDALERSGQLTAAQVRAGGPQLQGLLSQPATASVSATSDQLALEASAAQSSGAPAPGASPLLADFPSDSWFAFAATDAGAAFAQALSGGGGAAIQQALGFDLGSELGHWAGDVGAFVRGTSLFGLGGALVLQTKDEQASAQSLDSLERALSSDPSVDVSPLSTSEHGFSLSPSGVPVQFQFVQRDGKVVAGLADSVSDVFAPSSRLADSAAYKAATGALGSDFSPTAFIDFGPLFQLVDGFPQASSDPGYQQAKPYLDHLDYLIAGTRSEGDRATVRVALGLQDSSASADSDGSQSSAALALP